MMRVRLKADGRIVEILPDGNERTVDHNNPAHFVRQVRARCGLTQAAFAEKIEVPIETVRNWEQGKRAPRMGGGQSAPQRITTPDGFVIWVGRNSRQLGPDVYGRDAGHARQLDGGGPAG